MQRSLLATLVAGVMLLLASCASTPAPEAEQPSYSYAQHVELEPGDTIASIEAQYGGKVEVWLPDAGFAVLGVDDPGLSTLSLSTLAARGLEVNEHAFTAPEAEASAWRMWSGAWRMWSGAWRMWSGAWRMWSGGEGSSLEPTENQAVWDLINLAEAHDLAPNLGDGVTVAVIDTGIDLEHPVFDGHLADDDQWMDFVDYDTIPAEVLDDSLEYPMYGHGTAIAGIIRQVAPEAIILPIRVLGPDGSGTVIDVALGINWAVAQGADVINLSLGSDSPSFIVRLMVNYATSRGVYVVASAGNNGNQKVTYPAAAGKHGRTGRLILGVGSVEVDDTLAEYSSYGRRLELLAPGSDIYTAAPSVTEEYVPRLAAWSGTSMAAAVVSGGLALGLGETDHDRGRLAETVVDTSVDVSVANDNHKFRGNVLGEGRVDFEAFLQHVH